MIQVETLRARVLGRTAAVLGTIAFAALLLFWRNDVSIRRDSYPLAFGYYAFYLPGLCVAAVGLATGLAGRRHGRKEGEPRREAVIGICLSALALAGLVAVRMGAAWFVGADK